MELRASLTTLLFSVHPPSPLAPQSTALGAVPRLWHGHGMDGTGGTGGGGRCRDEDELQ